MSELEDWVYEDQGESGSSAGILNITSIEPTDNFTLTCAAESIQDPVASPSFLHCSRYRSKISPDNVLSPHTILWYIPQCSSDYFGHQIQETPDTLLCYFSSSCCYY